MEKKKDHIKGSNSIGQWSSKEKTEDSTDEVQFLLRQGKMRRNEGNPLISDIELENWNHGNNIEERGNRLELHKAALSNDWKKAESIYRESGMTYGAIITQKGETALHVAALEGHQEFVRNVVMKMNSTEALQTNGRGNTAFHCATLSGNVDTAREIARKVNLSRLAMIRGDKNFLPIHMAALRGNKEMVRYLYEVTKHYFQEINGEDRKALLNALINADIYDVAFEMTKGLISGGIAPDNMEEEALNVLALKRLNPFKGLMYTNAVTLIQLLFDKVASDETRVRAFIESSHPNPIFEAAKHGSFKFLSILIASYPNALFCTDENRYTIFHHAILNRDADIFHLINIGFVEEVVTSFVDEYGNNMLHLVAKLPPNQLGTAPGAALQLQSELLWFELIKTMMEAQEVNRKNHTQSSLHLRQMLLLIKEIKKIIEDQSGSFILFENLKMVIDRYDVLEENIPSTSQFQNVFLLFEEMKVVMEQLELNQNKEPTEKYTPGDSRFLSVMLLFKEMKKLHQMMQNNGCNGSYTPLELFEKEHEELRIQGKSWMRDTANSCMIVAALITTLSFAAAITVPGGIANDGYPNFRNDSLFKFFVGTNWASFLYSATSLLIFLSTCPSKYSLNDFRYALPLQLAFGLLVLITSTISMTIACGLSILLSMRTSSNFHPLATAVLSSSLAFVLLFSANFRIYIAILESLRLAISIALFQRYPSLLFKKKLAFLFLPQGPLSMFL